MSALPRTIGIAGLGATAWRALRFEAWLVLLAMTVAMVSVSNPAVILAGITLKAAIISMWFMHLKHESKLLVFSVGLGFAFAVFLFFLIQFDVKVLTGIA